MSEQRFDLPEDLKRLLKYSVLEQEIQASGPDQVEARIRRAIDEYPDHGAPKAAWSWFLARNEDYAGAEAWLLRAIENGPDEYRLMWRTQHAGFRFRVGDWMQGFRTFGELIEADPANPIPRLARSFEMKSMGDQVSGELDEICVMHMAGNLPTDTLFDFFRENGAFSPPERLKASFFVLKDPLDVMARIHRAEMFMTIGAPTAAYYDLHLADVIEPKNLALMTRLEDVRAKGLLADPPIYDVRVPASAILPDHEKVLSEYTEYLKKFVSPAIRGVDHGWLERVVGRADDKAFDFERTNRNFLVTGIAIALAADFLLVAGVILVDAFAPAGIDLKGQLQTGELSWAAYVFGGMVVIWALAVLTGAALTTMGAVQRLFRRRFSDLHAEMMRRRWFLRPLLAYGFALSASSMLFLTIAMHIILSIVAIGLLAAAAEVASVGAVVIAPLSMR